MPYVLIFMDGWSTYLNKMVMTKILSIDGTKSSKMVQLIGVEPNLASMLWVDYTAGLSRRDHFLFF